MSSVLISLMGVYLMVSKAGVGFERKSSFGTKMYVGRLISLDPCGLQDKGRLYREKKVRLQGFPP